MSNTKRCSGYKGHWECSEEYPDHQVPVENFGPSGDRLQGRCQKCMDYRNTKRPRHPDTNQMKLSWARTRAVLYYGASEPKAKRANPIGPLGIPWKECLAMATKDAESIAWVIPNDSQPINVIPFKSNPEFDNSYEEVTTVSKGRKRDQKVVSHIKGIYETCAVDGCDYSLYDVAHIHALKHGADDLPGNCIPLCPNHHRDLDRGMLRLSEPNGRSESDPIEFELNGVTGKVILNSGHEVNSKYVKGCINEIGKYLDKKGDASENAISES